MRHKDEIPVFLISDMHVQNKKYEHFIFISHVAGKYAAPQKIKKNLRSSNLSTCLHHMAILKSQNKNNDFFYDFSLIVSLQHFHPLEREPQLQVGEVNHICSI